jgi:hypothetical protein
MGQSWQSFTNVQRAANTPYTNNTGRTILVSACFGWSISAGTGPALVIGGVTVSQMLGQGGQTASSGVGTVQGVVPPGATYQVNTSTAFSSWAELR